MQSHHPKIQRLLDEGYDFEFGDYISRGFKLVSDHAGIFIGYTAVFFVISLIAQVIPFIGPLAQSFVLAPALGAGFYIGCDLVKKNGGVEFGDFFKGFNYLGPLALVVVFQTLIVIALLIVPLIFGIGAVIGLSGSGDSPPIWVILFAGIMLIPLIYLMVCWSWAPLLVIFYDYDAWPAMETSRKLISQQWFLFFGFGIVVALIMALGFLGLVVAILFTYPAGMAMFYSAFEDIVGTSTDDDTEEESFSIDDFLIDDV